jgi:hypothetical protein
MVAKILPSTSVDRAILIVLHLVIGLGAIGAGQALARGPSGESLTFKTEWLEGSPFPDYRIPGLFLLLVIAPTNLASVLLQWKRSETAPRVTVGTGTILVLWVVIQAVIIGFQHWSQVMWMVLFTLTTGLGLQQLRSNHHRD